MNDYELQIEQDLNWRTQELASLKRIAISNSDNAITYRTLLRASWAALYAHFEGFTKFAWELLLDKVQLEEIPPKELSSEFKLLALEKPFKALRGNASSANLLNFFETGLNQFLESPVKFTEECRLSTESNLWPNVYERECSRVGIKSKKLEDVRQRIKTLVARRNDIAHGKNMTINSIEEYIDYEKAALLVMDDLALQVIELLERRTYRVACNANSPYTDSP